MKKLCTMFVAGLMAISLVGCGSSSNSDKLVVGTLDMNGDFVSGLTNNSYDNDVRNLIHGYLTVVTDDDGVLMFDTKTTLDGEPTTVTNADGSKTFTFKLQDGLKWNDGKKVTANDYVFSSLLRASTAWVKEKSSEPTGEGLVGYDAYHTGAADAFAGVKLIDDTSWSMTISGEKLPFYWETSYVAIDPIPMHSLAKGAKITTTDAGSKIDGDIGKAASNMKKYVKKPTVSSGPYKFISFKDKQVQLKLNDEYKGNQDGKKPSIKQITIKTLDADKDMDTFLAGDVDMLNGVVEGDKIKKAVAKEKEDGINIVHYARNGYGTIPFATYNGPTKEASVRRAINYIIDKNEIATSAMGSYGRTISGEYGEAQKVFQDNKAWVNENLNTYALSIETANSELDQSSYKFEADGVTLWDATKAVEGYYRYNAEKQPLVIKHLGSEKNPITDNIKLQLTKNSVSCGIKYEVTITDFASMLSTYYAKTDSDAQYNIFNMATGYTEVPDPWQEFAGIYADAPNYNPYGINDAKLDELMMALRTSGNYEEYSANWQAYEKYWNEILPVIPTYTNEYYDFASSNVKGFTTTPFRNWAKKICEFSLK